MNAPVPANPREEEVRSRIRKIRAFSRNARSVCAVLFGFGLAVIVVMLVIALRSQSSANGGNGGVADLLASSLTPLLLKLWTILGVSLGIGVWLAALRHLYRLFGNLAAGAIYTPENVRLVRYVGLLWLLWAVLNILLPATLLAANRLFDTPVPLDPDRVFPSFGGLLASFAAAGLVLLVSWVMEVGLYEKEHADLLRRDADLMI